MRAARAIVCVLATAACSDLGGLSSGGPNDAPDGGSADASATTCASSGMVCGAHERCAEGATPACVCVVGYERENGACVFRGGLRDPGFQNKPQAWTATGGAVVRPDDVAPIDPGIADFSGAVSCNVAASVRQTFPMPAVADAEPFALRMTGLQDFDSALVAFVAGAEVTPLFFPPPYTTFRSCLGERAYGRDVELSFRPDGFGTCTISTTIRLDRVEIAPDATCSIPGKVRNGDFEGAGGWVSAGTGSAVAEVATNIGNGQSRGGRLATSTTCDLAILRGAAAPPLTSMDRPAIAFTYRGTTATKMLVGLVGFTVGEVRGTNTFEAARLCVPEYARGMSGDLDFALMSESPVAPCNAQQREFVVDDVHFESDPSCPSSAFVIDGGFERTGVASAWQYRTRESSLAYTDSIGARSGNAKLYLRSNASCGEAIAKQPMSVPTPAPGGPGPAIRFFYKRSGTGIVQYTASFAPPLAVAAVWTETKYCIPPEWHGRRIDLAFSGRSPTGSCGTAHAPETLEVDDVEILPDPSCQ